MFTWCIIETMKKEWYNWILWWLRMFVAHVKDVEAVVVCELYVISSYFNDKWAVRISPQMKQNKRLVSCGEVIIVHLSLN